MSDWPRAVSTPPLLLHTSSLECLGVPLAGGLGGTYTSATWPANNRALYLPFVAGNAYLVKRLWVFNGASVSGTVDMGLYDVTGRRLVSIGATTQAGTTQQQYFDIPDTLLGPGAYYLAVLLTTTAARTFRTASVGVTVQYLYAVGLREEAVGSGTLPATATFASSISSLYVPMCGLLLTTQIT